MADPAYPAAHVVAPRLASRFAVPVGHIEAMIDAAFWASLRREEGVSPKISLTYVAHEGAHDPLHFAEPLPMTPGALAKLAPAVERPGIHLGVAPFGGELRVWGTLRHLPEHTFVIEVVTSGLLVVKERAAPIGKFVNIAVLEGDTAKFVDERSAQVPDCPGVLQSLLGLEHRVPGASVDSMNVLVQLAASMRNHGRGGALLVMPAASDDWRQSIVTPAPYVLDPPFTTLSRLLASHADADDMRHAIDGVAGLTAVDGAMIMNDAYDVLAFGVKINRRRGSATVERIALTEPIEGSTATVVTPSQLGGTRHLSAAQFVHDQRDAVALVASQDGRFTIFKWSDHEDVVHAHRVEALLL